MAEPRPIEREIQLLRDLAGFTAERAAGEAKLEGEYAAKGASLVSIHRSARKGIDERGTRKIAEIGRAGEAEGSSLLDEYQAQSAAIRKEHEAAVKAADNRARSLLQKADTAREEARWQATAVFESGRESVKKRHDAARTSLDADHETKAVLEGEATALIQRHRRLVPPAPVEATPTEPPPGSEDPRPALTETLARVDLSIASIHQLRALRALRIDSFAFATIALLVIGAGVGTVAHRWPEGTAAGVVVAVLLVIGYRLLLIGSARKSLRRISVPLRADLASAVALAARSNEWIAEELRQRREEIEARRATEVAQLDSNHAARVKAAKLEHEAERSRIEGLYPGQLAELGRTFEQTRVAGSAAHQSQLDEATASHTASLASHDAKHSVEVEAHAAATARHRASVIDRYRAATEGLAAELASLRAEDTNTYPDWSGGWTGWTPPTAVPALIRIGELQVSPSRFPGGLPTDPELIPLAPADFKLTAYVNFREKGALVVRAAEGGQDSSIDLLRAVMLRLLTALPPSRVRFTILDPANLGRSFASFMHLADFDEMIVTQKIWTDPLQIDQKLKDLTQHMENVIQTLLRDDYPTIEAYNEQAGEVAEPYRVLVVASFPTGFTEASMRLLQGIIAGGARCGVYTLLGVDARHPLPFGFNLRDFEGTASSVVIKDGRPIWREPAFEDYRFVPDSSPAPEALTKILHEVGKISKEARRVQVPFEVIAPADNAWWTTDSRHGIDVPLGRAGATKLQHLALGRGTSQHVLVAGKTGSGKSTLLHALITNVALRYSPKEVEMYLIDFKKGVEFKTYATHGLAHARVVAIESEREFGLSVLQRLDSELKARGEAFRAAGAQDVASYRANRPDEDLPRILLIVDEFQEFFVEDDKIAQECSLLLDRLVRQGRAFGIHVHLGSQTLSGAYSLARSTLGQMAVRIALQCGEADAHLILSEENSAARLLSRPGEAIYNDANGLLEGNHVFQVVWLGDERREKYLIGLDKLAHERGITPPKPMIVFEGNTPAEVEANPRLNALLDRESWPAPARSTPAWLGDAIAIKDPTDATFQPQSGSNLLLVGQQDESAAGVVSAVLLGLAAQHDPNGARFHVFDGTPSDSPLAGMIARVEPAIPHRIGFGTSRTLAATIGEISAEIDRRRADDAVNPPAIYLVVHDLTRFRDLRKNEDDFGSYGSFGGDKPVSVAKQFVTILREGPMVNVHAIVWCDTVPNLNRTFDRQGLAEFEMRVLFQMSASDSSQLIDSPAAGRLGPNRALYFSEEQGRVEKFRPFAPPSDAALDRVRAAFAARPKVEPIPDPEPAPTETDADGNPSPASEPEGVNLTP